MSGLTILNLIYLYSLNFYESYSIIKNILLYNEVFLEMIQLIPAVIIALLSGVVAAGVTINYRLPVKRVPFKNIIKSKAPANKKAPAAFMLAAVLTAVCFAAVIIAICSFTTVDRNVSAAAMICLSLLAQGTMLTYMLGSEKLFTVLKRALCAGIVLLLCEVFVFNLKSFTKDRSSMVVDHDSIQVEGSAEFSDDKIIISSDTSFIIEAPPEYTHGIVIDAEQKKPEESMPFEVTVQIKDDNARLNFETAQDKLSMAAGTPLSFTVNHYGEFRALKIRFSNITKPVTISSITLYSALPFEFSTLRFLVLLVIVAAIIAVKEYGLANKRFNERKGSHILAVQILILVCTVSAAFLVKPAQSSFEYDPDAQLLNEPYSMVFDAFQKGHTYLDFNPESQLEELENVYDRSLRDESGVFALWDFAYYDQHYYCYFGVAPVITFYYPYYYITGKLPTLHMATAFFGILSIFFFCQTLLALIKVFHRRPNLLLLLLLIPACVSCFGAYYIINASSLYALPVASGLCYLFLCLWLGITACTARKKLNRLALLFISGAALAACVASRPGMAVSSLVLAPLFLGILLDKKQKLGYRLSQACCFMVPLLAGVFAVMMYNKARFDSPFDFGASYQLTVNDIHANKVSAVGFFPMLYHYFLQLPRPKSVFPFFEPQFCSIYNYTKSIYQADCIGVLSYALVAFGIIFMPMAIRSNNSSFGTKSSKLRKNSFIVLCLLFALFIAWEDFCLGGVHTRYTIDILPLLTMMSFLVMLSVNRNPEKAPFRYKMSVIALAATFCIAWLFVISPREANIMKNCPNLYDTIEDLVIFWQ